MIKTEVSENPLFEIALSINEQLKGRPYFFGIRNLEDSLVLAVECEHDSKYVKNVIKPFSDKASISLEQVSSLDDYLCLFSNKPRPNPAPDFLKTQQKVGSYIQSKTWSRYKLYNDVLVLDHGFVSCVLEFVYIADSTLFIYKTGVSRKHKEMRLRNRALERAADFFERRFSNYFNKIHAFAAYSFGRYIEVQKKFERDLQKV